MSTPNILFLMSDEHRFDVTGCYGNDIVRTPVLDSLAESGAVFDNAYCPSPICVPGRQAMMMGKYPRANKCENYGDDIPPFSQTFAKRFAQYGYSTVCCGKLHHDGPDQMQGWTNRPAGDAAVTARYIDGANQEAIEKHNRPTGNVKWSDAKEILRAGIGRGGIVRDERAVRAAEEFIEKKFLDPYYDRQNPDKPLMLKVSLVQPHYPYFTPYEDLFNYYLPRVKPFLENNVFDHPFLSQRSVEVGKDVLERDVVRVTAAYYAMVETIDTMYGQVMDALESAGQDLDEWIIVYTTDHGEMLGEHGIWEKQKFFEASARVPLIIRWPKKFKPQRIDKNVNLIDLYATLCECADLPIPDGLDSRSLVPMMMDENAEWDNETASQFRGGNLMIKRDNLKYQYFEDEGWPEVLFDLDKDPGELTNLIDEPAYADAVTAFRERRERYLF